MKEKPNSTRTYDGDGFRRRAACLCVRKDESEVLLVSSSSAPDRWIVPGGGLEPNEEPSTAAMREVMEEGGVRGRLGRCLGTFEECKQRVLLTGSTFGTKSPDAKQLNLERKHRTMVFILEVTEELEEWEDSKNIGRKRKWFPIDEALRVLSISKPVQCNYVKLLMKNDKVP
uniref:Putative diadenosine and diphosphoinositol polyphosphate phosphohydrolase n=1 Tax=Amblyomma aureolatum TaxID=187763 RepID=A0A1E1WYU9_9ACAR